MIKKMKLLEFFFLIFREKQYAYFLQTKFSSKIHSKEKKAIKIRKIFAISLNLEKEQTYFSENPPHAPLVTH